MDNLKTKLEKTPLGRLEMNKTIVFVDWRLGVLNAGLMVGVTIFCVYLMVNSAYVESVSAPTIQYWFGGDAEMNAEVTAAATTLPAYCSNPTYNYNYCGPSWCSTLCPAGRLSTPFYSDDKSCPDPIWDDRDILCRSYSLSEASQKIGDQGFVMTLAKTQFVQSDLCGADVPGQHANFSCPARTATQRQWWTASAHPSGTVCTCKTQQDFFALGAEKITMSFQHGFGTSPQLDTEENGEAKNWRGSSTLSKHNPDAGEKKIHTTVYKKCPPGVSFTNSENSFDKCKRVKGFKPGETIVFSVEDWLAIAGTSLDERVSPSAVPKDQTSELYPTRRSVGTNLEVVLTYQGRTDDPLVFECAITVKILSESWGSAGNTIAYNIQRGSSSSDVKEDYVDTFARGVKFDFSSQGYIKRFDWFTAINYFITTVLLIINVIPAILKFVAFHWPNDIKAPVYEAATNEKFMFDTALAGFAADAAMAAQFASTFPANSDGRISRADFGVTLAKRMSPFTADAITDCIFHDVAKNEGAVADFVTQDELIRLFTADTFILDDLLKRSFSKMDEFPPASSMNIEELRVVATMSKVTVASDPGGSINKLTVNQARDIKEAYIYELKDVFSGLSIKNIPTNSPRGTSLDADGKGKNVKVKVPPNGKSGDSIKCTLPDGNTMMIKIPAGKNPGDLISIPLSGDGKAAEL